MSYKFGEWETRICLVSDDAAHTDSHVIVSKEYWINYVWDALLRAKEVKQ